MAAESVMSSGGSTRASPSDQLSRAGSSLRAVLDHPPQRLERGDHARLHGAQRDAAGPGDLGLARAVVEAHAQEAGLLLGQPGKQAGDAPLLQALVEDGLGLGVALSLIHISEPTR